MVDSLNKWQNVIDILFIMIPVMAGGAIAGFFSNGGHEQTIYAAILGGVGGIIGVEFFYLFQKKTLRARIIGVVGLTLITISTLVIALKFIKSEPVTCQLCGYEAVDRIEQECQVCGSLTWEIANQDGSYSSKEEWLKM